VDTADGKDRTWFHGISLGFVPATAAQPCDGHFSPLSGRGFTRSRHCQGLR
jgi:hypothetical protein